jgi:hypothetical protein
VDILVSWLHHSSVYLKGRLFSWHQIIGLFYFELPKLLPQPRVLHYPARAQLVQLDSVGHHLAQPL